MTRFSYQAIAADGQKTQGEIVAEDSATALSLLHQRNLTPIALQEGVIQERWWNRDISLAGPAHLPHSELEKLLTTLAAMLEAGFQLPRSLEFAASQSKDRRTKRILEKMITGLQDGRDLAQVLQDVRPAFPEDLEAMLRLGDLSNQLPEIAREAGNAMASEIRLRRELRSALFYPAILMLMSILVLAVVIFYLAPTLLPVFHSLNAPPPAFLLLLNRLGEFISQHWGFSLAVIAMITACVMVLRGQISRFLTGVLLRLPLTGSYLRKRESTRLAQSLFLILRSGGRLPEALAIAGENAKLPAFQTLIEQTAQRVLSGETLSTSLIESPLIDPIAAAMIGAGEESNRLPDMLGLTVTTLRHQTAQTLNQALQILSPILILLIGLGIGGLILSTISAIMQLNDISF